MSIYKISLSDAQADKLADWLTNTTGEVDSRVAEEIRAQIPKPPVPEPAEWGSVVRAFVCGGYAEPWVRTADGQFSGWSNKHGTMVDWHKLCEPEVLRVGIGLRQDDSVAAYSKGREDFANAMRRDVSGLLADAITAERRDAYDKVLASISALLGES